LSAIRVIFVDDEPRVLEGLKRMLRPKRNEWQMTFVGSAQAALEALRAEPCEVVVTDMRMPGMRMSVTTTSHGSTRSASSAACALPTNVICHSLRLGRSMRFSPSSTRGSSSTKMTRIAFKQRLRPPFLHPPWIHR